jgi:hypothetical protein
MPTKCPAARCTCSTAVARKAAPCLNSTPPPGTAIAWPGKAVIASSSGIGKTMNSGGANCAGPLLCRLGEPPLPDETAADVGLSPDGRFQAATEFDHVYPQAAGCQAGAFGADGQDAVPQRLLQQRNRLAQRGQRLAPVTLRPEQGSQVSAAVDAFGGGQVSQQGHAFTPPDRHLPIGHACGELDRFWIACGSLLDRICHARFVHCTVCCSSEAGWH